MEEVKVKAVPASSKKRFPLYLRALQQLKQELAVYVWWFNNKRYHQTLNYLTPVQYRLENIV